MCARGNPNPAVQYRRLKSSAALRPVRARVAARLITTTVPGCKTSSRPASQPLPSNVDQISTAAMFFLDDQLIFQLLKPSTFVSFPSQTCTVFLMCLQAQVSGSPAAFGSLCLISLDFGQNCRLVKWGRRSDLQSSFNLQTQCTPPPLHPEVKNKRFY